MHLLKDFTTQHGVEDNEPIITTHIIFEFVKLENDGIIRTIFLSLGK